MAAMQFKVNSLDVYVGKHDVTRVECLQHDKQLLSLVIRSSAEKHRGKATLSGMDVFTTQWSLIAEIWPADMQTAAGLSYNTMPSKDYIIEMGRDRLWLLDVYRNKFYKK